MGYKFSVKHQVTHKDEHGVYMPTNSYYTCPIEGIRLVWVRYIVNNMKDEYGYKTDNEINKELVKDHEVWYENY